MHMDMFNTIIWFNSKVPDVKVLLKKYITFDTEIIRYWLEKNIINVEIK